VDDTKRVPIGPAGRYVLTALHRYRKRRKLNLSAMSRRLEELGRYIPAQGLKRIECGDRRVDVDDLIALARVLDVPPIKLILPVGQAEDAEVLPGQVCDTWATVRWFIGDGPFPAAGAEEPSLSSTYVEQLDHLAGLIATVFLDGGGSTALARAILDAGYRRVVEPQHPSRGECRALSLIRS